MAGELTGFWLDEWSRAGSTESVISRTYDVFISHASEDKAQVAAPLAAFLLSQGFRVWLDQSEITVGDSLRRSIDQGLSASSFGIVILSPDFLRKGWTNLELDGLIAREVSKGKVILPILHHLSPEDILRFSPILASKVSVSTVQGLDHVAREVVRAIQLSRLDIADTLSFSHRAAPLEQLRAQELSELRKQMIAAISLRELQEIEYRIDEFLDRYPNNPEARILKRDINKSLTFCELSSIKTRLSVLGYFEYIEYKPSLFRRRATLIVLISLSLILGVSTLGWILWRR